VVSVAATSLRDALEQKMRELGDTLEGMDEEDAARRPADGEWSCKEMLSHLMGDEGESFASGLHRFLDEDTPLIGVVAGLPYYSPARQTLSLSEMRAGVWRQYEEVAIIGSLSDDQLARKGRCRCSRRHRSANTAGAVGRRDHQLPADHIGRDGQVREARQMRRSRIMAHPVVPSRSPARTAEAGVLSPAFDWKIEVDPAMNYGMVDTGGEGINGGVFEAQGEMPSYITFYVQVDDLQAYLDKAQGMGGKTIVPPTPIPNMGAFAMFHDPEGNLVGLFQG
jgi:predicted enzyme related to lactoylglutathione lyase